MSTGNEGEYMGCDERPDIQQMTDEQLIEIKEKEMSVHKKLAEARDQLRKAKISKSGRNSHQGFEYYELSDFVPKITEINNCVGLSTDVAFDADTCVLNIRDVDGDGFVSFSVPMASAQLPGKAQPVQNLGATITYMRRYLYMLAYDITEPDAIDSADQSKFEKTSVKGWKNESQSFIDEVRAIGASRGQVNAILEELGFASIDQVGMKDHAKFLGRLNHIKVNS